MNTKENFKTFDAVDALYESWQARERKPITPEEETACYEGTISDLAADPILQAYSRHTQTGLPNTKPEHAFGERLSAILMCLRAQRGEVPIRCSESSNPEEAKGIIATLAGVMILAEVYLWSKKIERIAEEAPLPQHTVSREVLPFPLMFWSSEDGRIAGKGKRNNWVAVLHATEACVVIGDIIEKQAIDKPELILFTIGYGRLWPRDYDNNEVVAFVLKRCAFLASPYVTTERRRLPHHVRRQLERDYGSKREALQNEMHVVALRRAQARKSPNGSSQAHNIEWKHQWWVGAHYRAQWYATQQAHKVIWIAPHLKGPSDKPILEKMYAVVR